MEVFPKILQCIVKVLQGEDFSLGRRSPTIKYIFKFIENINKIVVTSL
jgi:hypothetical protein